MIDAGKAAMLGDGRDRSTAFAEQLLGAQYAAIQYVLLGRYAVQLSEQTAKISLGQIAGGGERRDGQLGTEDLRG